MPCVCFPGNLVTSESAREFVWFISFFPRCPKIRPKIGGRPTANLFLFNTYKFFKMVPYSLPSWLPKKPLEQTDRSRLSSRGSSLRSTVWETHGQARRSVPSGVSLRLFKSSKITKEFHVQFYTVMENDGRDVYLLPWKDVYNNWGEKPG